jgi:hypothetical protein
MPARLPRTFTTWRPGKELRLSEHVKRVIEVRKLWTPGKNILKGNQQKNNYFVNCPMLFPLQNPL